MHGTFRNGVTLENRRIWHISIELGRAHYLIFLFFSFLLSCYFLIFHFSSFDFILLVAVVLIFFASFRFPKAFSSYTHWRKIGEISFNIIFPLVNWSGKMFVANPRPLMCDCVFIGICFVQIHSQSPSLFLFRLAYFRNMAFCIRTLRTREIYAQTSCGNEYKQKHTRTALIIMWIQSVNVSIDRKKKSKIGFLNYLKELLRWYDFGIKQNPKPAHTHSNALAPLYMCYICIKQFTT